MYLSNRISFLTILPRWRMFELQKIKNEIDEQADRALKDRNDILTKEDVLDLVYAKEEEIK